MIIDLSFIPRSYTGEPFGSRKIVNEIEKIEIVTAKEVLLNQLGRYMAPSGKDAIAAYSLGQRIYESDSKVEINNEEADLIRRACDQPQYVAAVIAQVLQQIDASL